MDRDTHTVTKTLDAARERCGLTNAEFARALGTSPSRYSTYRRGQVAPAAVFLVRALRISQSLAAANQREILTSPAAAASIDLALQVPEDWGSAAAALERTRQARDAVTAVFHHCPEFIPVWEAGARIADPRWHTLFAAIVGHAFESNGYDAPRWTQSPACLPERWMPVPSVGRAPEEIEGLTPDWLSARNILLAAEDLETPGDAPVPAPCGRDR